MSSIVKAVDRTYKWVTEHSPPDNKAQTYWAIDLHSTVLKPDYQSKDIAKEPYPYALEVLRILSESPDDTLIMFTSSKVDMTNKYKIFFLLRGIAFKYLNSNPEVKTQPDGHGCFDDKFYFNVMLEDKAGFDPETDWKDLFEYLNNHYRECEWLYGALPSPNLNIDE